MKTIPFTPLPLLGNNHAQTIVGSFGFPLQDPPSTIKVLTLDDGDQLHCPIFTPSKRKLHKGIVLLLHGLGGSHGSHYMRRITSKLYQLGYTVICMNRRGCGPGIGYSRRLPHGGLTQDVISLLTLIRSQYPKEPIQIIGFSIGGNLLLKLLGELGSQADLYINRGIAVSPLVDLKDATKMLGLPSMRLYEKYYVDGLLRLVEAAEKAFPELEQTIFPSRCSIQEYDERYTAPKWGYRDADEYYRVNSANQFIPNIQTSCEILHAKDDPFIRFETIESVNVPPCVNVWASEKGGHMGFLGYTKQRYDYRWMDEQIVNWVEDYSSSLTYKSELQ